MNPVNYDSPRLNRAGAATTVLFQGKARKKEKAKAAADPSHTDRFKPNAGRQRPHALPPIPLPLIPVQPKIKKQPDPPPCLPAWVINFWPAFSPQPDQPAANPSSPLQFTPVTSKRKLGQTEKAAEGVPSSSFEERLKKLPKLNIPKPDISPAPHPFPSEAEIQTLEASLERPDFWLNSIREWYPDLYQTLSQIHNRTQRFLMASVAATALMNKPRTTLADINQKIAAKVPTLNQYCPPAESFDFAMWRHKVQQFNMQEFVNPEFQHC